jgi:uncharacterized membrane protein YGL010W
MQIAEQLQAYANFHRDRRNVYTHMVGIPLIVFAMQLWTSWLVLGVPGYFTLPLSLLLTSSLLGFYTKYNWRIAGIAAMYLLPLLAIAYGIHFVNVIHPVLVATSCFVLGWALQFIGHIFEAQKPAFMDNLLHLLIGPLFIILELHGKIIKTNLLSMN